eukprot:2401842-Karenia_brevis.AAC.1
MALVLITIANGIVPCDDLVLGEGAYNHVGNLKIQRQTIMRMRQNPIYHVPEPYGTPPLSL